MDLDIFKFSIEQENRLAYAHHPFTKFIVFTRWGGRMSRIQPLMILSNSGEKAVQHKTFSFVGFFCCTPGQQRSFCRTCSEWRWFLFGMISLRYRSACIYICHTAFFRISGLHYFAFPIRDDLFQNFVLSYCFLINFKIIYPHPGI